MTNLMKVNTTSKAQTEIHTYTRAGLDVTPEKKSYVQFMER